MKSDYFVGVQVIDASYSNTLVTFPSLKEAKEYVKECADSIDDDFLSHAYFYVDTPEGKHIYGCSNNVHKVDDVCWYAPGEKAYVYDSANDTIREIEPAGEIEPTEEWQKVNIPEDEDINDLDQYTLSPVQTLPDGWQWKDYADGSGGLNSPDGEGHFSYDAITKEFRTPEINDDRWCFWDRLSSDAHSISQFHAVAEEWVNNNMLKTLANESLPPISPIEIIPDEISPLYPMDAVDDMEM